MTPPESLTRMRLVARRLGIDRYLRSNAIFFAGNVGAGIFAYAFQFVVGRILGPANYSIVAAAVAALYILTLPTLVVQLIAARFTSLAVAVDDVGQIRAIASRVLRISLTLGLVIAIALLIFRGPAGAFLQLKDLRIIGALSLSTVILIPLAAQRGILQGMRRFTALSGNLVLEMGSRVALGGSLAAAGIGVIGPVFAIPLASAIAFGQSRLFLRGLGRRSTTTAPSLAAVGRYATPAAVAVMGVTFIFNIDVLMAKHFLDPRAAGIYAATAVLGRVIYFLGVTIAGVMFPEVATLHARDQAHYHVVDLSLAVLAVLGMVFVAVYALLPGVVLFPFGAAFRGVAPYLAEFALALVLLAVSNLLINYFLSINSWRFALPLVGACLMETALMITFHGSVGTIVSMLLLSLTALTGVLAALYAMERLRAPRQPS